MMPIDLADYPLIANMHDVMWGTVPIRLVFELEPPAPELLTNARMAAFSGGRVVLIETEEYGLSAFPGGLLEPGEAWREGLDRELLEEAGARVVSFEPVGRIHLWSGADAPFLPHLPFPEFHWLVGYGDVEIVGGPTNPPDGEHVHSVSLLPLHEGISRLSETNAWEAELLRLVGAIRAGTA